MKKNQQLIKRLLSGCQAQYRRRNLIIDLFSDEWDVLQDKLYKPKNVFYHDHDIRMQRNFKAAYQKIHSFGYIKGKRYLGRETKLFRNLPF